MGKALLFILITLTSLRTLLVPHVGIIAYYTLALLGPQHIWHWAFEGVRVSLIVSVTTILSAVINLFIQRKSLEILKTKTNAFILVLFIAYVISFILGPYTYQNPWGTHFYFEIFSKIVLFYFISVLMIDDLEKCKYLSYILIGSTLYLIYWANLKYVDYDYFYFDWGRLMGPFTPGYNAPYKDQNNFAMVFVCGIPFMYYWSMYQKRILVRLFMWGMIPLGWHAIFLTGSRGGLVGIMVTLLGGFYYSKKKFYFIFLIPIFIGVLMWQGGEVMLGRSSEIVDYQEESSAEGRLQAWAAAYEMIKNYPVTGVGVDCFVYAMKDHSNKQPRDTHNTSLKFASEVGIMAMCCYIAIVYLFFITAVKINKHLSLYKNKFTNEEYILFNYLNRASSVSFFGLITCSLFLSLNYFEIFFYLILISGSLRYCLSCKMSQITHHPDVAV